VDVQHSFHALAQHGHKRQDKHGVLLTPSLHLALLRLGDALVPCLERLGDLGSPLVLQLAHAEQRSAHDSDDDGGEQAKC
jgi:hypothetical protein